MFSIGLEFSLPKLRVMRREVFGLGAAQVTITIAACVAFALAAGGGDWQSGLAIGGVVAMSSTAVVSKLLAERMELDTAHGRSIVGVLLFQDLAVVPLLILVPVLAQPAAGIGAAIAVALAKAAFVLAVLLLAGPRVMRAWFGLVARRKSTELFVLNVLLVILAMAFLTGLAGLSFALGAFLAGMLISETEYRYRVEDEIKPFRDVLLGLFFVTVGMMLDLGLVAHQAWLVLALVLSMMATPFLIGASNRIVLRFAASEWMLRSLEMHRVAVQSLQTERHVIILGYGRNGQHVARLLEAEKVRYIALESGLMLASHTLVWVGVPLNRVVRRLRAVRDEQYGLLRGLFHGASDEAEMAEAEQPRLQAVTLTGNAHALGKPLDTAALEGIGVQVRAVRRPGSGQRLTPQDAGILEPGDVVVLLGVPELLAAAEIRLLQG